MTDSIWTWEMVTRLKDLWNQTEPVLSTAQIGRMLGISKNSALAKAHRLKLPAREPIAAGAANAGMKRKRDAVGEMIAGALAAVRRPGETDDPLTPAAAPSANLSVRPRDGCRWPLWHDKERPTMEFCGLPIAAPGEPYCPDHRKRAWCSGAPPKSLGWAATVK